MTSFLTYEAIIQASPSLERADAVEDEQLTACCFAGLIRSVRQQDVGSAVAEHVGGLRTSAQAAVGPEAEDSCVDGKVVVQRPRRSRPPLDWPRAHKHVIEAVAVQFPSTGS